MKSPPIPVGSLWKVDYDLILIFPSEAQLWTGMYLTKGSIITVLKGVPVVGYERVHVFASPGGIGCVNSSWFLNEYIKRIDGRKTQ